MKKPRFAPRPALLKQIVDRSNYSIHPRSKTRMVSNRFWHIVSVVKERTPLSSRKALPQPNEYAKVTICCQPAFRVVLRFPQASTLPKTTLFCSRMPLPLTTLYERTASHGVLLEDFYEKDNLGPGCIPLRC
jgi:hypothetical protein